MATAYTTKQALQAAVTAFGAITAGGTYFNTLTGTRQVSSLDMTREERLATSYKKMVFVFAGGEEFPDPEITGNQESALFELIVVAWVKNSSDSPMEEELLDLRKDIMLVIGANTELANGLVSNWRAESIERPIYDEKEGFVTVYTRCEYDFESGSDY